MWFAEGNMYGWSTGWPSQSNENIVIWQSRNTLVVWFVRFVITIFLCEILWWRATSLNEQSNSKAHQDTSETPLLWKQWTTRQFIINTVSTDTNNLPKIMVLCVPPAQSQGLACLFLEMKDRSLFTWLVRGLTSLCSKRKQASRRGEGSVYWLLIVSLWSFSHLVT